MMQVIVHWTRCAIKSKASLTLKITNIKNNETVSYTTCRKVFVSSAKKPLFIPPAVDVIDSLPLAVVSRDYLFRGHEHCLASSRLLATGFLLTAAAHYKEVNRQVNTGMQTYDTKSKIVTQCKLSKYLKLKSNNSIK